MVGAQITSAARASRFAFEIDDRLCAENAAERVTNALGTLTQSQNADQQQLVTAIGDVIEIVPERSRFHTRHIG